MPENRPSDELFTKMVTAGFEPIKQIIEFGHYEDRLTPKDINLIMVMVEKQLIIWVDWLKYVKNNSKNDGK